MLYRSSWCGSRPKKRSTSHLPPGEETPNAWTSGRRKGKLLVTIKLVFKHRRHQPLYRWNDANRAAQQRRPSHQHFNSIDKKRSDRHRQDAHILVVCNQHRKNTDTSKEWKSCTTVRSPYNRMKLARRIDVSIRVIRPGRSSTYRSLSSWNRYWW